VWAAFHRPLPDCNLPSCALFPVILENSTAVSAFVIPYNAQRFRRTYPSILVGYGVHPVGCFGWSCRRHVRSIPEIHQDLARRCSRAGKSFIPPWYAPFQPPVVRFQLNLCTGTWDAVGHVWSAWNAEAGKLEDHYLTTYGSIVRWKGPLGVRES